MRAAIVLSILAFSCTAANSSGGDIVKMSTITAGSYAASETKAAVLATSRADYEQRWRQLIGSGEGSAPAADFDTGVVVFLLAGRRSTGGWSVEPSSVTVVGDGTAVIVAKIKGPPAGSMVTQALTSPYVVVHVADRNISKVRWSE